MLGGGPATRIIDGIGGGSASVFGDSETGLCAPLLPELTGGVAGASADGRCEERAAAAAYAIASVMVIAGTAAAVPVAGCGTGGSGGAKLAAGFVTRLIAGELTTGGVASGKAGCEAGSEPRVTTNGRGGGASGSSAATGTIGAATETGSGETGSGETVITRSAAGGFRGGGVTLTGSGRDAAVDTGGET